MKVLVLIDSLAPGGTETSTVLLAARLRNEGVETSIVTLGEAPHDLTDIARAQGTPVARLESRSFLARARELRGIIQSERPDLVHTALFKADQLGRWAAIGLSTPVIASFVNTPYVAERMQDPNVRAWKLRMAQMLDGVTARYLVDSFHAVSEGVKQENARALRLRPERVFVAERGRDRSDLGFPSPERRHLTRTALGIDDSTPLVLSIGRLEYQKGQLDLVHASAMLGERGFDHVLLIAGKPGSASADIERAIADSGNRSSNIRQLGHRDDVGDLLCAADVLVVSSLFEGTAGVALEAMAMGTPIVATDLAGTRGILENRRNSLVVPISSPADLTDAIVEMISDRTLRARLTSNGRKMFDDRFTLERSAHSMAILYGTVLGSPGPPSNVT